MLAAVVLSALVSAPPADYVVSKLADHRVVIVGESHWVRHEVNLIREVVPRLRGAGAFLAIEMLPARHQARLDALIAAKEWNEAEAIALYRAGNWPYREYVEILHEAWKHKVRVVGLSPDPDWREKMRQGGLGYDEGAAKVVMDAIGSDRRVLVYCGSHHAFSRYLQPEKPNSGTRVHRYMTRMGNYLRRDLGDDVFTIVVHRPWQCLVGGAWTYCLPFDGAIDCAMKEPAGFDVAGSPFGELRFARNMYYAFGHPSLRFVDFTDGYLWLGPVEKFEGVAVIPLSEYAPEGTSRTADAESWGVKPEELPQAWAKEEKRLGSFVESSKWAHLTEWRSRCIEAPSSHTTGAAPRP